MRPGRPTRVIDLQQKSKEESEAIPATTETQPSDARRTGENLTYETFPTPNQKSLSRNCSISSDQPLIHDFSDLPENVDNYCLDHNHGYLSNDLEADLPNSNNQDTLVDSCQQGSTVELLTLCPGLDDVCGDKPAGKMSTSQEHAHGDSPQLIPLTLPPMTVDVSSASNIVLPGKCASSLIPASDSHEEL